jgi:hypothetical protein
MEFDYIDDFEMDMGMVHSVSCSRPQSSSSAIADLSVSGESTSVRRKPRGALQKEPVASSGKGGFLRVGTPGVGMSRQNSARVSNDSPTQESRSSKFASERRSSAVSSDSSISEVDRNDVEHTITFKQQNSADSTAVKGRGAAEAFIVKTFRELRNGNQVRFDTSCALLGVGQSHGGQTFVVQRFPIAQDDSVGNTAVSATKQLTPSVVRALRTRVLALARLAQARNVMRPCGAAVVDGALFVSTTFACGGSLADIAATTRKASGVALHGFVMNLAEPVIRLVLMHVLQGLRALHSEGQSHGAIGVHHVFLDRTATGIANWDPDDAGVDEAPATAARSLVFSLGGFADAILAGLGRKGAGSVRTTAQGGGSSPQHHDNWAARVAPRSVEEGGGDVEQQFSPSRRGANGKAQPEGFKMPSVLQGAETSDSFSANSLSGSTSRKPLVSPGRVSLISPTDRDVPEDGGAADLYEDLRAVSHLMKQLVEGFNETTTAAPKSTGTHNTYDGEECDSDNCSARQSPGPSGLSPDRQQKLSREGRTFEQSFRDVLLAASMAITAASRRRTPINPKAAIAASLDRIDSLLGDPYLDFDGICTAIVTDERKIRARTALNRPDALCTASGLMSYATKRYKAVSVECLRHRAERSSFRFGSMAAMQRTTAAPTAGAVVASGTRAGGVVRLGAPVVSAVGGSAPQRTHGLHAAASKPIEFEPSSARNFRRIHPAQAIAQPATARGRVAMMAVI